MQYSKPRKYENMSRYSKYRQILDNTDVYTETFNKSEIPKNDNDTFHVVQNNEENRLDIISNTYYKDASMYWVIALANNLVDPFILKSGSILRIPSLSSLYAFGGVLSINE